MNSPAPIMHRVVTHDYYAVQTEGGKHEWLAVPAGTPTKIVKTPAHPVPTARLPLAA
jgi:hypothetical protein